MKRLTISVNGKPYTVEVGDISTTPISVVVNGETYSVEMEEEAVASPQAITQVAKASSAPAVQRETPRPMVAAPATTVTGIGTVIAPMPGKILSVRVTVGQKVAYGDELVVLEAMKMENMVRAQGAGVVKEIKVTPGQSVGYGQALVLFE